LIEDLCYTVDRGNIIAVAAILYDYVIRILNYLLSDVNDLIEVYYAIILYLDEIMYDVVYGLPYLWA
jgi:hypothetical protein